MKRIANVVGFLALVWACGNAPAVFAHDFVPAYVVLGDSIESGVGASDPANAYVALFHAYLESASFGAPGDLHNHAVPGATARDIKHAQLAPAMAEAQGHAPVVVSWGGGGNDLRRFIASPEAVTCAKGNVSCLARLNALLNEVEQTVDLTVKHLRGAAGPDATILLRTQYNPFWKAACGGPGHPQAQLAHVVLEGGAPFLARGLNDRIRDVAARYQARVVEIYVLFAWDPETLVHGDCTHPSDAGHAAIAAAAVAAL